MNCSHCGRGCYGSKITYFVNGVSHNFCCIDHAATYREEHRTRPKYPERKEPKWVATALIWLLASVIVIFFTLFIARPAMAQDEAEVLVQNQVVFLPDAAICRDKVDAVAVATTHTDVGEKEAQAMFLDKYKQKLCATFEYAQFVVGNVVYENKGVRVIEIRGTATYYLITTMEWVIDPRTQT